MWKRYEKKKKERQKKEREREREGKEIEASRVKVSRHRQHPLLGATRLHVRVTRIPRGGGTKLPVIS